MSSRNPALNDWHGLRVWILGASEGIGAALARQLAARGARLALSARGEAKLAAVAAEIGGGTLAVACDAASPESVAAARAQILAAWQEIDLGIYMAGDYTAVDAGDGPALLPAARRMLAVNYGGALEFAAGLTSALLAGSPGRPRGLVLVASVAGYRGLPQALGYGPTKAALIHLAEILHLELVPQGVGVWLVNPGFVSTRLTAANDFSMPALMTPEAAAAAIVDGLRGGRFEIHFPQRFSRFMKLLALLPYAIYFPLVRRFAGRQNDERRT